MRIVYADGPYSPRVSPAAVLSAAGVDGEADVTLGWTLARQPWIDDGSFRGTTLLAGYALSRSVDEGRVRSLPIPVSKVTAMLADDPPEIGVVTAIRRGDELAFHRGVGWADVLARVADRVVVEVVDGVDLGAPHVDGNVVATIERHDRHPVSSPRQPDSIDGAIAAQVVDLMPENATLQVGVGAVPDTIAASIDRPLHVWSGLITDAVAGLLARGLLSSPVVSAYTWGGAPIDRLYAAGMLRLESTSVTHDVGRLVQIPRLIAVNAALQVGLDGSVNVERVAGRTIAGIGGHSDFSAGASRSPGGMSIVALRSTDPAGRSTIVPLVDKVSTPRTDVDVVVTEHGVARLRGRSDDERAALLIGIAAPHHRDALRADPAARPVLPAAHRTD